jgi:hypothetical protein
MKRTTDVGHCNCGLITKAMWSSASLDKSDCLLSAVD